MSRRDGLAVAAIGVPVFALLFAVALGLEVLKPCLGFAKRLAAGACRKCRLRSKGASSREGQDGYTFV